jgi:phage shock protein PspC (stress-responsive transcriptional regulator)
MVRAGRASDPALTMTDDITPNENDPTPTPGEGGEEPTREEPTPEQPTPEEPLGGGPERPTTEQPTTEQPLGGGTERPAAAHATTEQATTEEAGPRRLYRSRSDRVIGGVCAGIARYFNIDPVIVRIAAVALIFLGGTGIVAYIAALLLMPNEGEGGGPAEPPRRGVAVAGAILLVIAIGVALPFHGGWWDGWSLVPLGLVAIAGLLVWRLASGQRPQGDARAVLRAMVLGVALIALCFCLAFGSAWAAAAGGNGVVAAVVIAAGLALIAGAFIGDRARWMILPALAIALPAGAVAATNFDVKGGYGDKTYRPASVGAIRDSYRLGAGKLVVDLRGAHLRPGSHAIKLRLGVGEAQLLVPRNVCVSTRTHLGIGGVQVFDRDGGGIDVDRQEERDAAPGTPRLVVDANVGIGAFQVHHQLDEGWNREPGNGACA